MSAGRVSDVAILVIAGAAIALLAALGAAISPPPMPGEERGSSYSAGPDGAKAAFLTLKQLGFDIDRSLEPITALAVDPAETTLVLASPSASASEQDRKALHRFLEAGGRVIATGAAGASFLGGPVEATEPLSVDAPTTYVPTFPSRLASGAPRIRIAPETEHPPLDATFFPIYGPENDAVVRAARIGQGMAIWWAGSTPLSNAAVAEPGHLELLLNAVGSKDTRSVLWDERYHGHVRSLWSYAAATPLPWVLFQFGVMAAAALLTWSRRRGPVRANVVDSRSSPMEFVDTMGGLYEQARAASASVATARTRVRRLLQAECGLPLDSSNDALAHAVEGRLGVDGGPVADLLDRTDLAAAQPGLRSSEALALVSRLQALAATLGQPRRGPDRWSAAGRMTQRSR